MDLLKLQMLIPRKFESPIHFGFGESLFDLLLKLDELLLNTLVYIARPLQRATRKADVVAAPKLSLHGETVALSEGEFY